MIDAAVINDGVYRGPFPGQQTKFCQRTEREVFFGGAGGGGKSVNGLGKFAQQLKVERDRFQRGEIVKSKCWGLYLRRTMPDLQQAIDRSWQFFKDIDPDAEYNINEHLWTIPSCGDAHFQFGHMENEKTKYKYKSSEYTYCVGRGTRVLMAEGFYRPIENICVGDMVQTLVGPREVTRAWSSGIKPCVRAVVRDASGILVGEQVHPIDHPVLAIAQERPQPLDGSSQSDPRSTPGASFWTSYESLSRAHLGIQADDASPGAWEIGSAGSCDEHRATKPLPPLNVPVVLYEPLVRQAQERGDRAPSHATSDPSLAGSLGGCPACRDSRDERPLTRTGSAQAPSPQPGDAEERTRGRSTPDGQEPSPRCTHSWRRTWRHPYTSEERDVGVDVAWGTSEMSSAGDVETFDLTIADANHYITDCGLINRNCFFDELTEFTESMYEYMDTRLRTTDPVLEPMLQLCSASNPDGPGLLWVRRRFIEGKEPETIYRKVTKLRDGRIRYYDSIFIPAKLEDNPILYQSGQYEASLLNKRPEVREAILHGNWYINPGAFLANVWDSAVHVVKNHDVPRGLKIVRSCDPGIGAPSCVTWYYVDRNGGLTGIHNLYVRNHDATMLAQRIREVEEFYGWWDSESEQSPLYGPMDEDAFNRNMSGGPSYAEAMRKCGVRWKRSRKDRFNGAAEIVRRLSARVKDIDGEVKPLLRYMERCKSPIETLPVLQSDPNDPNDVDTKGDDHAWDEVMYQCLDRVLPNREKEDEDDDDIIDLDAYRRRGSGGGGSNGSGGLGIVPGGW